MTVLEVNTHQ